MRATIAMTLEATCVGIESALDRKSKRYAKVTLQASPANIDNRISVQVDDHELPSLFLVGGTYKVTITSANTNRHGGTE